MATVDELEAELTTARSAQATAEARIKQLNEESKGHRLDAKTHKETADRLAADATAAEKAANDKMVELVKAKNEAEGKAAEAESKAKKATEEATQKAQQRAINADLKIAAKDASAVDVNDVLALLDRTKIKTDAEGEITNAAELMAEIKKIKPHLFGITSSSSTTKTPPKDPPTAKNVSDMSEEEFEQARKNRAWRT